MKDFSKKIETTFGQIKIFGNPAKKDENKILNKDKEKTEKQQETKVEISYTQNENEDFFGFEKTNLNYFDQNIIDQYKRAKENDNDPEKDQIKPFNPKNIESNLKNEDLNFIDEFYFANKDDDQIGKNEIKTEVKDITVNEIESIKDVNFIDQQMFKNRTEKNLIEKKVDKVNDEDIGTLKNFKEKNNANIRKNKENQKTIPLVQSKNIMENDKNKRNFETTNKLSKTPNLLIDQSKLLLSEVPNWNFMTLDEAANILNNHICYYNKEEGILAIDKPYGLPSMGGPGVNLSLTKLLPIIEEKRELKEKLLMCNRLDENTTGVILFATNKETANKIRTYYNEGKIIKQYLAITKNIPEMLSGEINIPLIRRSVNGIVRTYLSPDYNEETKILLKQSANNSAPRKNAVTLYRVIDSNNKSALLELQPKTGFQHQIRAHLAYGIGCPILGDHKYSHYVKLAPQKLPDETLKSLKIRQTKVRNVPMHLHAYSVILSEFHKSTNVFIKARLPVHFVNNLKRLKLKF